MVDDVADFSLHFSYQFNQSQHIYSIKTNFFANSKHVTYGRMNDKYQIGNLCLCSGRIETWWRDIILPFTKLDPSDKRFVAIFIAGSYREHNVVSKYFWLKEI